MFVVLAKRTTTFQSRGSLIMTMAYIVHTQLFVSLPSFFISNNVVLLALGGACVVASLVFYANDPELQHKEFVIYWLLLASATLTVIVNAYDDIKGLKPLTKLIAQTVAVLIILGPWFADMKFHGVLLFGFSNPFGIISTGYQPWFLRPEITLFISPPDGQLPAISLLAIPAVLLTWFWIVGMMNTINWIDGMDG